MWIEEISPILPHPLIASRTDSQASCVGSKASDCPTFSAPLDNSTMDDVVKGNQQESAGNISIFLCVPGVDGKIHPKGVVQHRR